MNVARSHPPGPVALAIAGGPARTLPGIAKTLRQIALTASLFPLLAGALVLAGWTLDIEILKRMVTGLTAMNPMTAVGFIGIGLALALTSTRRGHRLERTLAIVLASAVALIGIVRVLAVAGVYDAGIDRILFADKLALADVGRP